ncbi:amino acid ABC transporter membrane protein 2, PAAT family [Burkholderia sp. GAS332]|nr:amino acid ABC transporter membrane protein 2, PAAT family [Burkholderia sp. GAS332]
MDLPFIYQTFVQLLPGIPLTLELASFSVVLGGLLGLIIALLRLSPSAPARALAWVYVQVIRSVPLLVLLFMIYYGLSQFPTIRASFLWPFLREPYWCALIALTINTSAYASEIIRGGLRSVPRGQREAAYACGMSPALVMRRIILPLAVRQALPAYSNEIIAMVKATSLASLVTLMDVTGIASSIATETYRPIEVFVSAGIIYFLITYVLTRAVHWLEYRLNPHLRPPVIENNQLIEGNPV